MNLSYPHREALVVRNHELRVIRRLAGNPEIKVRAGERIGPDHVIARTDPKVAAIKIPVADQLGVGPRDASKFLMRPVGSTFGAGEALARARRGLRSTVVTTPVGGVLLALDAATGVASIAPGAGGEVRSFIAGDVEYVDGHQAVSIRTVGSRLLGIVGLGAPTRGPIRVIVSRPDEEVGVTRITADLAGKIAVGGSWAGAAALKRLVAVGALGLITGGFVEREIAASLGIPADDRLAPWRLAPGDEAIGANLSPGLALMATEGFGALPMHPEAFALLTECNGQEAVLLPATRVTGFLARPELIVAEAAALDSDGQTSQAAFTAGARVRLTDQAQLGKIGTIAGAPRRSRRGDGNLVDVVDVELAGGGRCPVPLANLEIIA